MERHSIQMYYFSGTEQQKITVAPSSASFSNWRAILSPTWPSRELESSSVGDISMRQALENANLLQIIKSTLAGTRTRTMDQTRFLPSLYQGSGNNAPQEPSEVSVESPVRSQDTDEITIVSGLPQISVFSALSTSPSVTRLATAVSSHPMPYTSSISKETISGSNILSTAPSPSPLPLETESPRTIIVSKLIVPPTKVPLSTDTENSFSINIANTYFNHHKPLNTVIAGNSDTTKYALSRKSGREFPIAISFSDSFGLIKGSPITPAERLTDPAYRKSHSTALRAKIPNHNFLLLPNERVSLDSSKVNAFSRLIPRRPSVEDLTSQPLDAVTSSKEVNSYATASPPFYKSKEIPLIPTLAPHISSSSSALEKTPDLPAASQLVSTEESSLPASKSSTRLFHLMKNVSVPIVPTVVIPEAISINNAIIQAPALTTIPISYSTDHFLTMRKNGTFSTTTHASIPNNKVVSKVHRENPVPTKSDNWVFTKPISDIDYETTATMPRTHSQHTLWPHNYFLVRSLQRRSLTKVPTAKLYTNEDANRVHLHQSPAIQTTNFTLGIPTSKATLQSTTLERILLLESTGSAALSVSLPTSIKDHLNLSVIAPLIPTNNYSRNVQLNVQLIKSPTVGLTEEEGKNARVLSTVTSSAKHLSLPSLNKSDANVNAVLHKAEVSSWTTVAPLDLLAMPSFAPRTEPLRSRVLVSQAVSNAASKGISDILNAGNVFKPTASASEWDVGSGQPSTGIKLVSRKRITRMSQAAKDNANLSASKPAYSEVSVLQQQKDDASKQMPSSSVTSPVNAPVTSTQNSSVLLFTGTKTKGFTELSTYHSKAETSFDKYSSVPQIRSTFSKGAEVLLSQSKEDTNTLGNVLEDFTVWHNFTSDSEKKFHSISKYFTTSKLSVSPERTAHFPTSSIPSRSQPSVSYSNSQTMQKPQTTNSKNLFASTNALYATSPPLSLASQRDTKLTIAAHKEITSSGEAEATVAPTLDYEVLNSTQVLELPEEYVTSEKSTQFTNNPFSETDNHLSKQPTTFSTGGWYTEGTIGNLDKIRVPNEATLIAPLQTHTTNAIITSVHAPSTQLTSPLLPTTNFTHSVITVLPSVSPGVIPSVATSEATPVTGKSARTSPVLTSSMFSLSTENSPSVMALSTLISTLAKNNTATKLAPTLSPKVTYTAFPVISRDKSTTPVQTPSSFPITKASTVSAPTTHAPRQTETTVLDTTTSSGITKTSTAYPLTITAALTSITASAKTSRLLPTPEESTSAAVTTVSTETFANVTTVLPLECLLTSNLLIKTGMEREGEREGERAGDVSGLN